MRTILAIFVLFLFATGCKDESPAEGNSIIADSVEVKAPVDFIGEYFNPAQNSTGPGGLRLRLVIRKDSVEGRYLVKFTTVASKGTDSCTLETRAVKKNDTLFTHITTGVDTALMYITQVPHMQVKTLDVFTTQFRDRDVLGRFCIGNASLIGNYEVSDKPSSMFDSTQRQLGFIRSFEEKKASEVQLFQFAVIKDRLAVLLGAEEFGNLEENWIVEQPFEKIEDDIYLVSACKTTRCNVYKTNIFFDIPNDNITVIISKKGENTINTEKPSLQLPPSLLEALKEDS